MAKEEVRRAIEAALAVPRGPAAYLDTNVLLDVLPDRDQDSRFLIQNAPQRGWFIRSSFFALIEVVKRQQQTRFLLTRMRQGASVDDLLRIAREPKLSSQQRTAVRRDLEHRLSADFQAIEWFNLDQTGWQTALDFALDTDVSSADSLHVAVAASTDCDFVVTHDTNLQSSAASVLPGCTPGEARELLAEFV